MKPPVTVEGLEVALRLVRVEWEGPLSLAEALQKNEPSDYGLYMIEGHNILYGKKGGLYFGMAGEQTFAGRLSGHQWWINSEQDVSIRLGRLRWGDYKDEPPEWRDWFDLVKDVERLTIYWHAFPYNSQNIWSYSGQPIRVQNWFNRGNLQAEYSSDWQPPRPPKELEE
jgi:hypothetical protein